MRRSRRPRPVCLGVESGAHMGRMGAHRAEQARTRERPQCSTGAILRHKDAPVMPFVMSRSSVQI